MLGGSGSECGASVFQLVFEQKVVLRVAVLEMLKIELTADLSGDVQHGGSS